MSKFKRGNRGQKVSSKHNILAMDIHFGKIGWVVFNGGNPLDCGVLLNKEKGGKKVRVSDDYVTRASFLAIALSNLIRDKYISGIVGELPSGGAQSASAMVQMNMATAIIGSVVGLTGIPAEWASPSDVKIATCGHSNATKKEMMDRITIMFNGRCDEKLIKCRMSKNFPAGVNTKYTYHFCTESFGSGAFEHIADACGAYLALADGNLIKMLG